MPDNRLDSSATQRLRAHVGGDVLADRFDLGRYATDASHYQVFPRAVVIARSIEDVRNTLEISADAGLPLTVRGGGTSQNGQTINEGVVVDTSRHLNRLLEVDAEAAECEVEPGIVLDELNRQLAPYGLWYPVDISTSSRATLGGMAGNNSCGGRSLRYGTMRDNTLAISALLADGTSQRFDTTNQPCDGSGLVGDMLELGRREAEEIRARTPQVQRRVGGYGLDALLPERAPNNLAHLLVGSEGTLAFTERLRLKLSPLISEKVAGVCHFGTFHAAMEAAQHIVALDPLGVELVDQTMISLARDIEMYRPTVEQVIRGEPAAVLIVEFAETGPENEVRLRRLAEMMGDLGHSWDGRGPRWGGVVPVRDPALQGALGEVRKGGLNIMMSMKSAGKPVSFVEDCAVPLEHLAEYTARLTEIFESHGTSGTWYAHAAVGCLHVRPILNLKLDKDLSAMRSIAEEAFELVRRFKGSHSGEHGDGIVRSEFHEAMFGTRMVGNFLSVKDRFDPKRLLNPGRIVEPPRMDDRDLLRFHHGYDDSDHVPALDWSAYSGGAGGLQGAAEMCNNNGACRKLLGGVMCPSFRATRNERDSVRGRANTLRLALSGQLGRDALSSDEMAAAMALCVGCKACRSECPTGVDMARMKIEVQAARVAQKGLDMRSRAIAYLPRYAGVARALRHFLNPAMRLPVAGGMVRRMLGFSSRRQLPQWARPVRMSSAPEAAANPDAPRVALFADSFNGNFEPEVIEAAHRVLTACGYRVELIRPPGGGRALCCGRTFLATGLVEQARAEARRSIEALLPLATAGVPIVGLEPSCLLTFRDELRALLPGPEAEQVAARTRLFEEFLAEEIAQGLIMPLRSMPARAHLHGHCHQKSFGAMPATERVLRSVPELEVSVIASSCCGMAGAFGLQAETEAISRQMGEAALAPAIRAAAPEDLIVADGSSCRQQIAHLTGREARHVAQVLADALLSND